MLTLYRHGYSHLNRWRYGNLGHHSYILPPLILSNRKNLYIGNDVGIWWNARIDCITEWLDQTYHPCITIGDNCAFGQDLHMTCAEKITICNNVVITARVTITDINHVLNNANQSILNCPLEIKPVFISEDVFIGVNAVIMPGVTLGKGAVIGANSVVTKDVPAHCVVAGSPAHIIRKL